MQDFKILDGRGNPVCYTQAKDLDEVKAVTRYLDDDAPPMAVCPCKQPHPNGAHMVSLKCVRSFMEQREILMEAIQ